MKRSTTAIIIAVLAVITAVAGGIMIIYGFTQLGSYYSEAEGKAFIIYGLCALLMTPITYGFAIIVDAANRYLEMTTPDWERPWKSSNLTSQLATDRRASDEERIANLKVLVENGALTQKEFEEEVKKIKGNN